MEHKQWPARSTFDEREIGTGDVHYALSPCLCVACHLLDNLLAVRDVAGCPRCVHGLYPNPFLLSSERRVKLGLCPSLGFRGEPSPCYTLRIRQAIREVIRFPIGSYA